ncbi:MAG: HU family DNA-binding protein [Clostridia bacterium]|nr:HU family DNA-binding protein [Clostridia bacterium]
MNKTNLINNVKEAAGIDKKQAEKAVNAVLESIQNALCEGDKVQLAGFGTFKVKERGERTGRNPRTKEIITVPASKAPAFVPGKAFKDAVNK